MTEEETKFCDEENCPWEDERKCLEGFSPADQCPHLKSTYSSFSADTGV